MGVEKFIPVSQLRESHWALELPEFVDEGRIGLHVGRLGVAANLAGFKQEVQIIGFTGDTTGHDPMVVGSDSQGTAFMGAGAVKNARLTENEFTRTNEPRYTMHDSPFLEIGINTAEITQRLQYKNASLRDPAVWAPHLDQAVSEGLRHAAWKHMAGEANFMELIAPGGYMLASSIMDAEGFLAPGYWPHVILAMNMIRATSGLLHRVPMRELCWSAIPVIHPDRALAVSALTRMRKIVKALPDEAYAS